MKVTSSLLLVLSPLAAHGLTIVDPKGEAVANSYLAVLKPVFGVASVDAIGVSIQQSVGTQNAIAALSAVSQIAYIEPNYKVKTQAIISQKSPENWGLARLSSRTPLATKYLYDERAGNKTFAYIIDTGIDVKHKNFQGRAKFGYSTIPGQTGDGNGHGTHVAGIVGSQKYGVAKKTCLIAVKVLDDTGSGSMAGVIEGLQWALADAKKNKRLKKSVANMSLAGGVSQAMDDAVNAAAAAGLFVAVAAGNSNVNTNTASPANAAGACTVAATDITDRRAGFSNWGPGVDIFAPGVDIASTWKDGGVARLSGTSMASPHIAGLAAYTLSIGKYKTPADMCNYLKSIATKNIVTDPNGTVNQLAFNGAVVTKNGSN
ncbi:proteinase T [Microdochium bolleyi]|uniref:Proteinase T n=1 Tax=Microdochium bolleyi TaxID=196109 RepID=A0A136ILL9_9PEZI|nr:proteinase T [Microdochium bolleyi]